MFANKLLGLPYVWEIKFRIDLKPSTTPMHKAPYQIALSHLKELKLQLQELADKEFIQLNSLPLGVLVLLINKKDGMLYMFIDYQEFNKVTIKNKYPQPMIDNLFN